MDTERTNGILLKHWPNRILALSIDYDAVELFLLVFSHDFDRNELM